MKRYNESLKLVEKGKKYGAEEALGLIEKMPKAKFDETVELHVKLGVDSKHADQQVRGTTVLPHGTGKSVRVVALSKVKVEDAKNATKAGVEEGLVPGGGVALARCQKALDGIKEDNEDIRTGINIVRKALIAPLKQIAVNAGLDGAVVVDKPVKFPAEFFHVAASQVIFLYSIAFLRKSP